MKRDSWRDVKINCDKPRGGAWLGNPIKYEAPRFVTEMKIKQMMKAHFPDGPRAAECAQVAHWAWRAENSTADLLPFPGQCPITGMTAEAQRWDTFYNQVMKWCMDQDARGIKHGHFDYDGVDFNGLDRARSRGRSL